MAKGSGKGTTSVVGSSRIQVKNPVTNRWVKIDTSSGRIVAHKKSSGPYKGVPRICERNACHSAASGIACGCGKRQIAE